MAIKVMEETVQKIMASGKGVLALDWSPATISKQFEKVGLISTPELNRIYRQMLITTPEIERFISGIILHDETIHQKIDSQENFVEYLSKKDIVVGARADCGSVKYKDSDQEITKGLEGLEERLREYSQMGIGFSKWRAGFKITDIYPTNDFLEDNIQNLVRFAVLSHKYNLVPFVEPDVEIKGNHTTSRCEEITTRVLNKLFDRLKEENVLLSEVVLKTNMVSPGVESGVVAEPLEVANATLRTFEKTVPKEIGGIVFLSGGLTYNDSVDYLDKIQDLLRELPDSQQKWEISFSFARALQKDTLSKWSGKEDNIKGAQETFRLRLEKVCRAREGKL